jgi:cellulose synthase/poly-beta-1,6-N-acetylglucosamine synthase-like glycosyltransferase
MLTAMSSVTVVIPVLDDADMLARCFQALERQTRRPDAVLVVDNGSVDRSADLARCAGAIVVREPRRGILPATARGFDAADADILARIDADSRPEPDWLDRVMTHFESCPESGAVTGTGRFYGGRPIVRRLGQHLYLGGYFLWMGLLLGHSPLYGSNFAIRSELWQAIRDRVHRTDPRLHDDLDLSFQLPHDVSVHFDAELTMPVSARPFATVSATARRVGWGFRTIWVNGREQNLWLRRRDVLAHRQSASANALPGCQDG